MPDAEEHPRDAFLLTDNEFSIDRKFPGRQDKARIYYPRCRLRAGGMFCEVSLRVAVRLIDSIVIIVKEEEVVQGKLCGVQEET